MNWRIALLILLGILAGRVEAYSSSPNWRMTCNGTYCTPAGFQINGLASQAAACDAGATRIQTSGLAGAPSCHPVTVTTCGAAPVYSAGACGTLSGMVAVQQIGQYCPNGGTLVGSNCQCASGETDTGSACVAGPPCPDGQAKLDGVCTNICPANGRAWSSLDSYDASGISGLSYPSGQSTVCVEVGFAGWDDGPVTDKCRVVPTGSMIVCADYGGGSECFTETARYTGSRCSTETDTPQNDATECAVGDLWCKNTTGTCAAGFVGASFNDQPICVKQGEPVNAVPQPRSPAAPPRPEDVDDPPTHSDPSNQTGESEDPNVRTVVGVGDDTTAVNGSGGNGTGSGGGGGEDIITCGLPDTPPCKIDETGTPTGETADAEAKAGVNTEAGKLTTKLDEIVAGTGAPDRSWGFSISFPTTCNPMTIGTANWGFYQLDFCQWQAVIHDIMSLIWVGATLFLVIGMVFRTVGAG